MPTNGFDRSTVGPFPSSDPCGGSFVDHPKFRTDEAGNLFLNFGDYGREVEVACFSGDGGRLLTVQEVGLAKIWQVASGRQVGEIPPSSPLVGSKAAPTTSPFQVFV